MNYADDQTIEDESPSSLYFQVGVTCPSTLLIKVRLHTRMASLTNVASDSICQFAQVIRRGVYT